MKKNILKYKDYHTKIHYCKNGSFRGIIEGINDYIDFQTNNITEVEKIHNVVDDYLTFVMKLAKLQKRENIIKSKRDTHSGASFI